MGHVTSEPSVTVVKLGGSVLTNADAYRRAATFVGGLAAAPGARVVAVVSAEQGHTDALLGEARGLTDEPDDDALALLWSTGELRSVALLTFALHAAGIRAAGLNVQETGIRLPRDGPGRSQIDFNTLSLRVSLARYRVVVAPGFLALSSQRVVTLGRGGSDLTAVLLTAALGATRCILIKDVDGYYTSDPRRCAGAELIPELSCDAALRMADGGCPLVQRQALAAACARGVELIVRSFESTGTRVASFLQE